MVQASKTRTRVSLLAKQQLVPYADDGENARRVLAAIQLKMLSFGDEPSRDSLDEIDKLRPEWTRQLRAARYQDFLTANSST